MRWRNVLRSIGALIFCLGLTMLLPMAFSVSYGDGSLPALVKSLVIALAFGMGLFGLYRGEKDTVITHREGMAIVALGWLAAGLMGAMPFLFCGTCPSFVDAFFESVSGFSTTGASVLTDVEKVPQGILMWRSLTHWLGGMGIIVLSLAILPFLGVAGMQLYKAEVPGPVPDKLKPRMRETALILWKVYFLFTVLETILLMFGGMDFFEALCHTFGTMATGGFSTKNASVGHYASAYVEIVITVFMFVAGVNFALHYLVLLGRPNALWRDGEFRFFLSVVVMFMLISALSVYGANYEDPWDALRHAAFQVISIITTTGYTTANYEQWPYLPQAILLFCMFLGACAGSTGGGMKCMRIMVLLKHVYVELFHLIHPRSVRHLKVGGRLVSDDIARSIWGFFILYLGLFILASFLLSAMGVDLITSFSAVAATIGNIGPGLGEVGPADNYAHLPDAAKLVLSLCMLLGRLEIYTVVVLFLPEFWRK